MTQKWLEQELEDYIEDNPRQFFDAYFPHLGSDAEIGCLGRQVECAYGIIDLLYYVTLPYTPFATVEIFILELKAVQANRKTIEQALRYKQALEAVNLYMFLSMSEINEMSDDIHDYINFHSILVAPSFTQDTKWFGDCVLAEKTGDRFEFTHRRCEYKLPDTPSAVKALRPAVEIARETIRKRSVSASIMQGMAKVNNYTVWGN